MTKENKCVHELFEEEVARFPEKIALVCEKQKITYGELNNRANLLANQLQTLGVGTEVLIGLYMERSIDLVIGILAVLKTGGAYVSLDPQYPKKRISLILEDTQVSIILTQTKLVEQLGEHSASIICIDTNKAVIPGSEYVFINQVKSQDLAYVMYTSGSTGKPKGVEILHITISKYIKALNELLQINVEDVYLHTASFCFSSSLRQLLLPLTQGAKIVIATQQEMKNPLRLLELIKTQKVTVFDTIQSVWRYALLALECLDDTTKNTYLENNLRLLLFSGGLLPTELFQKVRNTLKNQPSIVNIYGQTETMGISAYLIPEEFEQETIYIPIGCPYNHVELYVLNDNLQPVGVGEIGEIYIGGTTLARGYFRHPELTQEKFIPHLFSQQSGARLYKTGDLARYLSDGNLECVGRADYQVKIRGFRIELGEIESQILTYPGIKEVIVTQAINLSSEASLVAYMVVNSQQVVITEQLRQFLEGRLPTYMIPSIYMILDALPLTPNGKIDRLSLPAPQQFFSTAQSTDVFPSDELETHLVKIWQKVLDIKSIGTKDNFFNLGGNSLVAVHLCAEIEQVFQTSLPSSVLFNLPTISEIAQFLRIKAYKLAVTSLVPIQPAGSKSPLFFVNSIGYLKRFASYLPSDLPVYGLNIFGLTELFSNRLTEMRIEDVAAKFIQDMQTIQPQGPYFLCTYCGDSFVTFEIAQQLEAQGQKVAMLAFIDSIWQPVDLGLSFHRHNLRQFGLVHYLFHKSKHKLKYLKESLILNIEQIKGNFLLKNQQVLSRYLQEINLLKAFQAARTYYTPQIYPGEITLFLSSEWQLRNSPKLVNMAAGGSQIYTIPGYHNTLFNDPYVQVLAQSLTACIDKNY